MEDDTIKRSDAIKALIEWYGCKPNDIEAFEKIIEAIPSVDRPQMEWIHLKGDEWLCPNCGHVVWTEGSWEHPLERGKFYCENCGTRLKGADDER